MQKTLTVSELVKKLSGLDPDLPIRLSSDEEMNVVYSDVDVCQVIAANGVEYILFGYSGSEIDY